MKFIPLQFCLLLSSDLPRKFGILKPLADARRDLKMKHQPRSSPWSFALCIADIHACLSMSRPSPQIPVWFLYSSQGSVCPSVCVCVFSCTLLTPCMVLNFSSHCRSWPDRIDPGHDWRFQTPQTWKKSIITLCTMWSNSQRAIMLTNLSNMWDFPLPDHFEMKVSHLTDHRAVRGLMNWKHFPTWRWPLRYRVDALTRGLNLWLRQEGSRRKWQISSVTEAQIKWR